MPKTFHEDMFMLEDLLERFASRGYTLEEVETMIDDALDNAGYYDELDEDEPDDEL